MTDVLSYESLIYGKNGDGEGSPSATWVKGISATRETTAPHGSADKQSLIWWDPGHHYEGRVTYVGWMIRPKYHAAAMNGPGRLLNFHTTPALLGGWGWGGASGGGVSPLAADFVNSVQTDDKDPTKHYEGVHIVAEATGDSDEGLGHQYHWTIIPLAQWDAAVDAGTFISIVAKITWGNINLSGGRSGALEVWINGSDTPVLNLSGINTHYVNNYAPGAPPAGGQRGVSLWTGGYVIPSAGFAPTLIGDYEFTMPRLGATVAEMMGDGVDWPLTEWSRSDQDTESTVGGPGSHTNLITPQAASALLVPASIGGGGGGPTPPTPPPTPTYSYQWRRDGTPIAAALDASYVLTGADVGHSITVAVTRNATGEIEVGGPVGPVT